MVQIPINWNVDNLVWTDSISGRLVTKWKLNHEWTIVYILSDKSYPLSIEFRRISTTENVSISGLLQLEFLCDWRRANALEDKKFSELMKSGSSSLAIGVNEAFSRLRLGSMVGVVNIISVSTLEVAECRKCSNMVELSNDLGRLLEPETSCFADVNLICGEESIPAHKNILSTRSPVFAAMFKHPMKENHENKVVISDIDVSVIRTMLAYMYTGNLANLTVSSASDLLLAADKYQLQDLKKECCEFLKANFSLENVLRILFLGEMYCNDLKSCAIDYICNTCAEISVLENTEEWKNMKKVKPGLVIDILTLLVKAKEKKMKHLAK